MTPTEYEAIDLENRIARNYESARRAYLSREADRRDAYIMRTLTRLPGAVIPRAYAERRI